MVCSKFIKKPDGNLYLNYKLLILIVNCRLLWQVLLGFLLLHVMEPHIFKENLD